MRPALIIAHRGASALAPENTLEAISLAVEMGVDMVECDLRRTADDKIVLHHDADVAGKPLRHLIYGEVRNLVEKTGGEVPILEDALNLIRGRAAIDLELKEAGYEKEIVKTVTAILPYDQFVLTSFLKRPLEEIKHIDPAIKTGLIQKINRLGFSTRKRRRGLLNLRWCETHAIDWYFPHFDLVHEELLDAAFTKDIPVVVWTVNDRTDMEKYLGDSRIYGICTDRPDEALSCRKRSGRS